MSANHTLVAEARPTTGKGAARQLRAKGLVPAVYYGPGHEPTGLAIRPKELIAALTSAHGRNTLIKLQIGATSEMALVQDVQIHPVTRQPVHVDFYRVDLEHEIEREVPFIADGRAKGVVGGGEMTVIYRALPLRAKPGAFPASIHADVTNLEIGDHIKVKDVKLPEGVSIALPSERNVISVTTVRKRKDEEEAAAPGAAAAGASAAPAAGGSKAPPAPSKPPAKPKK
ncbi:MAG TPA: 50S ribosomal protein L25 [Polyangiales bacterium]|nr:50S ribosomal protein L25 [Polyangiales bacterium]